MKKEIPISDIYFAAFASLHEIPPKLVKQKGHILFIFVSDQKFHEIYQAYFGNHLVPVSAFVSELKRLKSAMYLTK